MSQKITQTQPQLWELKACVSIDMKLFPFSLESQCVHKCLCCSSSCDDTRAHAYASAYLYWADPNFKLAMLVTYIPQVNTLLVVSFCYCHSRLFFFLFQFQTILCFFYRMHSWIGQAVSGKFPSWLFRASPKPVELFTLQPRILTTTTFEWIHKVSVVMTYTTCVLSGNSPNTPWPVWDEGYQDANINLTLILRECSYI